MNDVRGAAGAVDIVSFIRDEPAEEDFFQTHGRLARAISVAIRSNANLRVVGLLGRWGSGKSTVIKHLEDELRTVQSESGGTFRIFSYDAWLHQSDPVRRSFLQSLLAYLIDAKLTTGEAWKEKLLELSGQVEKTDVTQTPVLTNDAKWIFASLLPVPIAIGLLDLNTIKEAWGNTKTAEGVIAFWLAVLFLATPVAVTFVRFQINKNKNVETSKDTPLLPILMNRSVERTRSITHRSPGPSSIEFGKAFRDMMAEATKTGDRFVFVIDNLDRIGEKEALQIWATIRSFFLRVEQNEALSEEYIAPVVILPVDTHALERMFALSENEVAARELVRSFVNKTFDITFEVSEPVMSDWRAYLDLQMQKVFGSHLQSTWTFWTRHFFEESLQSSTLKVTPREINKLVNRLAALYIQWRDEDIQFEVLAYYAVRGAGAASNILQFISTPANDIERVAADWKLQFAALHYGVALQKAAQVLIEEPLRSAVTKRDERRFSELSKMPGFGDTFERLTSSSALNESGGDASFDLVTNAALLLSTIDPDGQVWLKQSWRNLIDRYFDTDGFGANANEIEERVVIFFPRLSGKQETQKFVDATAREIGASVSADKKDGATGLKKLASSLLNFSRSHELTRPTFDVQTEPANLLSILNEWASEGQTWKQLRTNVTAESAVGALTTAIRNDPGFQEVTASVRIMVSPQASALFEGEGAAAWSPFIGVAAEIVRQQSVPAAIPAAIESLGLLLRVDSAAKSTLEALLSEGHLQARFTAAAGNEDLQLSLAALLIWSGRNFTPPSGLSWDAMFAQNDFLPNLHERLRDFVGASTMKLIWTSQKIATSARPLLNALIRHIIETGDLGSIPLADIISDPNAYLYVVPWRLRQRFIWLLESYDTFWLRLEQAPLNDGLAEAAKFMSEKGTTQAAKVCALLQSRLEQLSADDWKASISAGSDALKIAADFFPNGGLKLGSRSGLYEALSGTITPLLAAGDRSYRKRWFDVAQMLNARAHNQLSNALCKSIVSGQTITNLNSLLGAGGDKLVKSKCFAADADKAIENVVLKQMQTKDGRTWLKNHGDEIRAWIRQSKSATKRRLSEMLTSFESGKREERKYWAEVIRGEWKLRRPS